MSKATKATPKRPKAKKANGVLPEQRRELFEAADCPINQITHLQRTIGNQAVQRSFKSSDLQAKLEIGEPKDRYEKEADRIADIVMRMPEPYCPACRETEGIRRQPEGEEEETLQQKPIAEGIAPEIQRQEEESEEEEEGDIRAKPNGSTTAKISRSVESSINSLRGGGQPLPKAVRNYFEPRFGYNFSGVRLHTGSEAAETAKSINAKAFTRGSDIVFGADQYSPDTTNGKILLGHELTHVVQQKKNLNRIQRVPRKPSKKTITKVEIYLEDGLLFINLNDGTRYHLFVVREKTNLPVGKYKGTHVKGREADTILEMASSFSFAAVHDPEIFPLDWKNLDSSKYDIFVYSSIKEAITTTGTKEGPGEVKAETTSPKKTEVVSGSGSTAAEDDKKVLDDFYKSLKALDVKIKTGAPDEEMIELLKSLKPGEREELPKYLKTLSVEKGTSIDLKDILKLSPSDRELLRVNLELASSKTATATELPKEIKLAIDISAKTTVEAGKSVDELNKKLGELAKLHAKVTEKTLLEKEGGDLTPIDITKLPIFTDMMMFEGLLAGASQKSPEIETLAKELTSSISKIRSFILEEIAWLAGELAVTTIISALLAPVSAGASIAASSARAVLVIRRLNKLRLFIQRIEQVYHTFDKIRLTVVKVLSGISKYNEFKAKYDEWVGKLSALRAKLETADIEEDVAGQIEHIEGLLIDEIQKQLDNKAGLGAILESFYIPEDITEEDLKELLLNIPKGVDELKDLYDFYDPSKKGDLEYTKTLAYKATLVGALLYPFVGYLAMLASNKLGSLLQDKSLGERLLGFVSSVTSGGKRKLPGRKKAREKLKKVKPPKKAKPKKAKKPTTKKPTGKKPKKEEPKDAEKKAKERDKKWKKLLAIVKKMPSHKYAKGGITKETLLKKARKISRSHKEVASTPTVKEISNRSYWELTIQRKDASGTAKAEFLMSLKERLKRGNKSVKLKLEKIDIEKSPEQVTKDIDKILAAEKKAYVYEILRVEHRTKTKKEKGWYIFGKMGKSKEFLITIVYDPSGLHFGTEEDPIPVYWYKHDGNYSKKIKLTIDGKPTTFDRHSTETVNWKGGSIRVGFDKDNLIDKCDKITREKLDERSGTIQSNYRDALKKYGYSWRNAKGMPQDADHVKDLAFQGRDSYDNLWPLDSAINRWAFTGMWYRGYGIEYKDKSEPKKVKTGTLYNLLNKVFKVVGFKKTPLKLGGRDKGKKEC